MALPDYVKVRIHFNYETGHSYTNVTVTEHLSYGASLNGVYESWCADVDVGFGKKTYPAEVWNT